MSTRASLPRLAAFASVWLLLASGCPSCPPAEQDAGTEDLADGSTGADAAAQTDGSVADASSPADATVADAAQPVDGSIAVDATVRVDGSMGDAGFPSDAAQPVDASTAVDATAHVDGSMGDAGFPADATVVDATAPLDGSEHVDASPPPDASAVDAASALADATIPDANNAMEDAASFDAGMTPDGAIGELDAGEEIGRLEFSPSSAQQGASNVQVNAVGTITFIANETSVMIEPASGAGIFQVQVTGNHYFTFVLDVANDAPVGTWKITAESGGKTAVGFFEITQRPVVTETILFDPSNLPRGEQSSVVLRTENINLYSTVELAFPLGSGVTVVSLVYSSPNLVKLVLDVAALAPVGEVIATVTNGVHEYHPKIVVVEPTASPLKVVEVLPHPQSLTAAYLELANIGGTDLSTAGWQLVFNGADPIPIPDRTLAPGRRLLLSSGSGVPGGAVVVAGMPFPLDQGLLVVRNPQGQDVDTVEWDLAQIGSASAPGIAMERVNPLVSGALPDNWRPAPAPVRSPAVLEDWQSDRGTPGRAAFVEVDGPAVFVTFPVEQHLDGATTLIHHGFNAPRGAWIAVMVDVDRVAGYATGSFYVVDKADSVAATPVFHDVAWGDAVAVLPIPEGTGTMAQMDVRVWSDPLELFEPTLYTLSAALPSGLKSDPASVTLLPGQTRPLAVSALFQAMALNGGALSVPVPADKLIFFSQNPQVVDVDAGGTVTAKAPGNTSVLVTFPQPDGPRTVDVPVQVGDPSGAGDTCGTAMDVTAGGHLDNQTTVGTHDDYDPLDSAPHCPAGLTAGDRVYLVHPTQTATYQVTVTPVGQFDPILYAVTNCDMQACLAGTALNGPGKPETISFTAQAGQTVFIVVDGRYLSAVHEGGFALDVAWVPAT